MNNDPLVISIYNQLKELNESKEELNPSSIIILTTKIITLVQKEVPEKEKGAYKKNLALTIIKLFIKDSDLDDTAKDNLNMLVDTMLPSTIDVIVSVAKHKMELFEKSSTKCFCF